jgi:NAD(P)-dependent dehydrogenase (short-subunit alcohol dehydrogenase family)
MDLIGKVAVITGAGGGWGRSVVEAFLNSGATVVVVERSGVSDVVEGWKPELGGRANRLICVAGDVLDEGSVAQVIQGVLTQHQRLDILVNMVGGFASGQAVNEMELNTWEHMLQLNLRSTFLCSKHASPPMIQQHWGRIINVASRAAVQPNPNAAAYGVAKAGVVSLTESQAQELKDYGITVNAILPSIVDTPANRRAMPEADRSRWPTGEEIAPVILFLASDEAKLVSGAAIPVYGRA